jgi:hypothetical protein
LFFVRVKYLLFFVSSLESSTVVVSLPRIPKQEPRQNVAAGPSKRVAKPVKSSGKENQESDFSGDESESDMEEDEEEEEFVPRSKKKTSAKADAVEQSLPQPSQPRKLLANHQQLNL